MTIVDRYLLFLFLKIFFVCFLSFSGLFIVVHLFSHLDELIALAEVNGWATVFYEFYLPRVAQLFDKTAGIMTLVAAIFSVSLLQRSREMTAIEAAGITKSRILRPIFVMALIIVGLTIVNREVWIPKVKDRLVREPQTWNDDGQIDMMVQEDLASGVVLRGDQLFLGERRVSEADAQLPSSLNADVPRIISNWAIVEPATDEHPAGLWFFQVAKPDNLLLVPSLKSEDGEVLLYTPRDYDWLGPGECFVACDFSVEQMAYGNKLASFKTTPEMIADLRKPKRSFGNRLQVGLHSRLLKPILDLTLLMLGLPMVIGGVERNLFVSAGTCFWIVGAVQLTTIACHTLGATSLIRPAAMAAWLPVAIFLPFAIVAMRKLKN